jgi:acyl carrier protein
MSVRDIVYAQIKSVAARHNKPLSDFTDSTNLLETGLDSLCMASLIASLDDTLKVDPFGTGDEIYMPVSVGDLVSIYAAAV